VDLGRILRRILRRIGKTILRRFWRRDLSAIGRRILGGY
jgi:hypothetical protein